MTRKTEFGRGEREREREREKRKRDSGRERERDIYRERCRVPPQRNFPSSNEL